MELLLNDLRHAARSLARTAALGPADDAARRAARLDPATVLREQ